MADFGMSELEMRLRSLSAADLSVIEAAASKPGSLMLTSSGSANDALWSDMETVGWTKRAHPFGQATDANPAAKLVRAFELTPEGANAVRTALARLKSGRN